MSRNNVRGPTSALTEFLRESGITPTTVARRRAAVQPQTQPVAGPNNAESTNAEINEEGNGEETAPMTNLRRRVRRATHLSGYASDDLDDHAPEKTIPKKRKLTKGTEPRGKGRNAKKKGDSDGEDDDDDTYTALSKSTFSKAVSGSGTNQFKKPAAPRKRRVVADKRTVVNFEDRRFPSLVSLCIQMISRHINDVEALGDIGAVNMTEISKAISKNRSLTSENATLFYNVQNTSLTFFDATSELGYLPTLRFALSQPPDLKSPALCTLALLNPNLTSLRIDFCGCIDDATMTAWCTALPSLTQLELLGPFLVRVPAWISFFESHPQLERFLITQSPRFDIECIKALVRNCKGLKDLRLREIQNMEDGFATSLKELKKSLVSLDLSSPSVSLSEAALIGLMKAVGPTLAHLDLSGHDLITDAFLREGIKPHARALRSLTLSKIPELTDEGVAEFFDTWAVVPKSKKANPPLTSLDLSRNDGLSSDALIAVLAHSGSALHHLNINGWKSTSEEALNQIARSAKFLRSLDVGWCREVNDFVIKELMTECECIKEVKAWGCNRLTEYCPSKRLVDIHGIEAHTVVRSSFQQI